MSTVSISPPLAASDRASLGGLPTEIKARIVELAWIQDERHRKTWRSSSKSKIRGIENYKKSLGKSVGALFMVNREFSELSAKYRFMSLQQSHKTDSLLFRCRILPLRARHFVHLELNPPSGQSDLATYFASALVLAGHLPNLNSLDIDDSLQESHLGREGAFDKFERSLVIGSFERLTSRVQQVGFNGFWTSKLMLRVLQDVPTIMKLRLDLGQKGEENLQDCLDLLDCLPRQTHLEDLRLTSEHKLGEDAWLNFNTTSLPHLTSLSCYYLHDNVGGLVSRFAGQLLELSTSLEYMFTSSASPSTSTPLSFPLLRKFTLAEDEELGDFSRLLESPNFPRVSTLHLPCFLEEDFSFDKVTQLFHRFPSLVSLEIDFCPSLSATQSAHFLQLCIQRNVHLKCDSLYSLSKPSTVDLPMTLAEYGARKDFMADKAKRVANFTSRRVERLAALGDSRELERMMPFLQGLEAIMELVED